MRLQFTILTLVTGAIFIAFSYAAAQVASSFLSLPPHSVATTDNALSPVINPAGLGIRNGQSIYLTAPYLEKADFGDWGFALGGSGLGFVGEFVRNDVQQNRNRYTFGFGLGRGIIHVGTAYSWTKGVDRENRWDIGLIARPFRFISLGAVVRGVNSPRVRDEFRSRLNARQAVGWDLGAALRPFAIFGPSVGKYGNRLTISADAKLRYDPETVLKANEALTVWIDNEDGYFENINYKFGASIEIVPGITGNLDYLPEVKYGMHAHDVEFHAGLSLNFGRMEIGGQQREDGGSGVSWICRTIYYQPTVLKKTAEKFVEIRLEGPLVEYQGDVPWYLPRDRTLYRLIRQIEKYGEDPDVAGIVLRFDGFRAGWAKLQELRDALLEFMYTGKSVVAYLESCGNGTYYLASAADHIFINPVGEVGLTGLSAHTVFIRRTLDIFGIDPQFAHIGRYKSSSEMYDRDDMSDSQREELDFVLDELFDEFVFGIADGRGYIDAQVRELIDDGPFNAADAYSAGLVDSLVYEDELEDVLKYFFSDRTVLIKEQKHDRRLTIHDEWHDLRTRSIAIVYGSGTIVRGKSSEGGLFSEETMGSGTIVRALRKAHEEKSVKGIVFRIESPGGSMLASEEILREVKRCTEGDDRKPIIVSMSDVAGSGGYYIGCMADTIIAQPGTITGSIGVITGKMTYNRLQGKLGISTETLTRGRHADMWGGHRSFTDEEWEKLHRDVDHYYRTFLERVAEGRGMDTSEVSEVAQGRIWTGSQAVERGLVDMMGGLSLAVELAAYKAGLREGERFNIKMYPDRKDFDAGQELIGVILGRIPESLRQITSILSKETLWEDGEPLLLMEYRVEIE